MIALLEVVLSVAFWAFGGFIVARTWFYLGAKEILPLPWALIFAISGTLVYVFFFEHTFVMAAIRAFSMVGACELTLVALQRPKISVKSGSNSDLER